MKKFSLLKETPTIATDNTMPPSTLENRSEKIALLENFCTFLAANGYMDDDWLSEPPYAIDEFMKLTQDKLILVQHNKLTEDSNRLDWMEKMMTPNNDYIEIYLAGLRDFADENAGSFQIESNPWEKFKSLQGKTLREAIDKAMKLYPNMK